MQTDSYILIKMYRQASRNNPRFTQDISKFSWICHSCALSMFHITVHLMNNLFNTVKICALLKIVI